jgi:hypothetical protein
MKDVELRARLLQIGMSPARADEVTRQIRDVLHPVAATAAAKMRDHGEALGAYMQAGSAGLAGYETDELSGLLKKIKKGVKKVAKVVKKVALPVAAIVAAPMTGGASVAAYGAIKSASIGKSASAAANEANIAMTNAAITNTPVPTESAAAAAPVVGTTATPNVSARIGRQRRARVPKPIADMAGQVAAEGVQQGYPADTAALMQAMLANQGTNMVSPAAQGIVSQAAAEGVQATPAGPSALPVWLIPAGLAALALPFILKKAR